MAIRSAAAPSALLVSGASVVDLVLPFIAGVALFSAGTLLWDVFRGHRWGSRSGADARAVPADPLATLEGFLHQEGLDVAQPQVADRVAQLVGEIHHQGRAGISIDAARLDELLEGHGFDQQGHPMAVLSLLVRGVEVPWQFRFGTRVTIGRLARTNLLAFPTDDLVSRAHARLVLEPDGESLGYIVDLASQNGTQVRRGIETRAVSAGERFYLVRGDTLIIGTQHITIGVPPGTLNGEVTEAIPLRFRRNGNTFPQWYRPENRCADQIWNLRKKDPESQRRLLEALRDGKSGNQRVTRWPVNFVITPHPTKPGRYQVVVAQKYWEGQLVPEEGVKHIQLADGHRVVWAGELSGMFDEQGRLLHLLFNANSGEYGQQLMSAEQADHIAETRTVLARKLRIDERQVVFRRVR